jgi:hypothetical protein
MSDALTDTTWLILLERIKRGRCLPLLAAGIDFPKDILKLIASYVR